jgi:putative ATP-dependent endonuclease of OLD family
VTPKAESDLAALRSALSQYFAWGKGSGQAADLLASCTHWQEMPKYITQCLHGIFRVVEPSAQPAPHVEP